MAVLKQNSNYWAEELHLCIYLRGSRGSWSFFGHLHLWRYSNPIWTRSWAACLSWPSWSSGPFAL